MSLIKQVKDLLSHTVPDGDLNAILKYMANLTVKTLKQRKGQMLTDEKVPTSEKGCVNSRYIPIEIRKQVFKRSGGLCEYIGITGHRCESHHQLEIDHIKPWSQGGTNGIENLRYICRWHNLHRTKETHGFWYGERKKSE